MAAVERVILSDHMGETMRKLVHAIALLLVLGLSAPVLAEPFEDAMAAYNKQDYATAMRLLRPLADQGNAYAQNDLGVMYAKGQGVSQDYVQAHKWLNLGAAAGNEDAITNRDIVAGKMTPAQIAEAQKLASAWKPK